MNKIQARFNHGACHGKEDTNLRRRCTDSTDKKILKEGSREPLIFFFSITGGFVATVDINKKLKIYRFDDDFMWRLVGSGIAVSVKYGLGAFSLHKGEWKVLVGKDILPYVWNSKDAAISWLRNYQ